MRPADDEIWTMTAVCDAIGKFPEPLEVAFPDSGLHGTWRLHVHCYVMWTRSSIILIDTGIGPPWSPAASWFDRPGWLLDALAGINVERDDVTDVVLTHVHADHVGGVVHGDADDPEPTFPNARHIVQQEELEHLGERPPYPTHIRPLRDAGLLDLRDGVSELATGIAVIPTPGHTPGHQSVLAVSRDVNLCISGDVFVHPAQVLDPDVIYRHEVDPETAAESRRKVLLTVDEFSMKLAPAHFDDSVLEPTRARDGRVLDTVAPCPG